MLLVDGGGASKRQPVDLAAAAVVTVAGSREWSDGWSSCAVTLSSAVVTFAVSAFVSDDIGNERAVLPSACRPGRSD